MGVWRAEHEQNRYNDMKYFLVNCGNASEGCTGTIKYRHDEDTEPRHPRVFCKLCHRYGRPFERLSPGNGINLKDQRNGMYREVPGGDFDYVDFLGGAA